MAGTPQTANNEKLIPGSMNVAHPTIETAARGISPRAAWIGRNVELAAFAIFLLAINLPLFFGGSTGAFSYSAHGVASGEWWRLLTHPFVHVTQYHLYLDGAAFLILYHGLADVSCLRRLGALFVIAAASLATACLASPLIEAHGLCGLSGIAHGLMAISTLETCAAPSNDRLGRQLSAIAFLALVAKCLFELLVDGALFASLHFGSVGVPIVACHAGGVIGALLWTWFAMRRCASS
jgi:rhomboid family GlyGly-CTERM serine protease